MSHSQGSEDHPVAGQTSAQFGNSRQTVLALPNEVCFQTASGTVGRDLNELSEHRLSATVQDSWQLRWWLLSQSGAIAVREPAKLREALLERLETGLAMHRGRCEATV